MKPVNQTKFGGASAPLAEQGDCFQACVASILEIPLGEAFDCRPYSDDIWLSKFNEWLKPWNLVCIAFDHTAEKPCTCSEVLGYHIMLCRSATLYHGGNHVVVIHNQQVVHDPNPNAYGRLGDCQGFLLLTSLNAARNIKLPK